MKKHLGIIFIGLAIGCMLLLYWVIFTVRTQEKALILTFGQITRQVDKAGLHWIWPWQKVVSFDTRIRTVREQIIQIQTHDKETLTVMVYLNWRIVEPEIFYGRWREGDLIEAEDVVLEAENDIRAWIADATKIFAEYDMDELITLDKKKFKLEVLEKGPDARNGSLLQRIRNIAYAQGDGYGIEIVDLGISRLGVPDSVTSKVFDRMNADRMKVVEARKSKGESEAKKITGKAESRASIIKADAEAQAKHIRGQGDAEAAEYYSQFLADPELANFLRRLETLRKTLGDQTTLVLDREDKPFDMLLEGPRIYKKTDGK